MGEEHFSRHRLIRPTGRIKLEADACAELKRDRVPWCARRQHASRSVLRPFLLILSVVLWEVALFIEHKVKNPSSSLSIAEAIKNPQNYNIAEFLSLEVCSIVEKAIKKSK